jgi:hypothetical protein
MGQRLCQGFHVVFLPSILQRGVNICLDTSRYACCFGISARAFDFDIDYILVVGHFGLAAGSGGKNPEQHAQRVVEPVARPTWPTISM